MLLVAGLLCLGFANVTAKVAAWRTFDDGVLWKATNQGVVAAEIAEDGPAAADLERGDWLRAIDGQPVESVEDAWRVLQVSATRARESSAGPSGAPALSYIVVRAGRAEPVSVDITPESQSPGALYFVLAAVGIFTLLVGGAVRLRRPRDPATLHFFWLAVAFFGVFTFSFSGRLDRLDWVFYWADAIVDARAAAAVPALHAGVPRAAAPLDAAARWARARRVAATCRRVVLGPRPRHRRVAQRRRSATVFVRLIGTLDRLEFSLSRDLSDRRAGRR